MKCQAPEVGSGAPTNPMEGNSKITLPLLAQSRYCTDVAPFCKMTGVPVQFVASTHAATEMAAVGLIVWLLFSATYCPPAKLKANPSRLYAQIGPLVSAPLLLLGVESNAVFPEPSS